MKINYLQPQTESFRILPESLICQSGGDAGNPGDPGAGFKPGDIVEGETL